MSPNCIAFEYASIYYPSFNYINEPYLFDSNNTGPFCLFYDSCKIISDSVSVQGINTYISPFSQSQSIENYCINNGWNSWNENGIPSSECFNASLWYYFTNTGVILMIKIKLYLMINHYYMIILMDINIYQLYQHIIHL